MILEMTESTAMPDAIPADLSAPLLAFIAISGLDVVHNAVHKAIYTLLTGNRPSDRVPVHFRLLDGDHEYPKPKPKKQSYEWYVPRGILKTNWMSKHLRLVPALSVIFFDLDWDEVAWNERLIELSVKVQVARSALEGRNTKVAVVLIQQSSPLPPGDDIVATERATALCAACDLAVKLLFVFPHTDHQFGYVIRLENAFYELAQAYYQQQSKLVKGHREFLNKTTHQLLFVRHQFKMAFYNELRHDHPMSLKHYKQAYVNLLEVRATDTNIAEVKVVAGFISYKICKLSFARNVPLDAISQFRKHVDIFKGRTGPADLAFEHSAWMSKQFLAFGDLFEEAIEAGLSAIQTQHPGFYYQQAAIHATSRKRLCEQLCKDCHYPESDPLADLEQMEFYGQRPWRPGVQSLEPPDPRMECDGIMALQHKEANEISHSILIISLLSNAIVQFKKYRCPRMKRYLVVLIAEQYFDARDYGKALTLFGHVMWGYRLERWWSIVTALITTAVKCAYAVANVQEYVTLCLEIIGKHVTVDRAEKERLQQNVIAVSSNAVPVPELGLDESDIRHAEELWKAAADSPLVFTVQMHHAPGFLKCKAGFDEPSNPAGGLATLTVAITVFCPQAIRFVKLGVIFSNQLYNDCGVVSDMAMADDGEEGAAAGRFEDLLFEPNVTKTIRFSFVAAASDVNNVVEIMSVVLQLGTDRSHCVLLHWKASEDEDADPERQKQQSQPQPQPEPQTQEATDCCTIATKIVARDSLLHIRAEQASPALVDEFHSILLSFENDETVRVTNAFLSVVLGEPSSAGHVSLHEDISKTGGEASFDRSHLGQSIEPGQQIGKQFFLRATQEGSFTLIVKVEYDVTLAVNGDLMSFACVATEEVVVPVVRPFSVTSRIVSPKIEPMDALWLDEMVILQVEIVSTSPWPIRFHGSRFDLNCGIIGECDSQIKDVVLNSGDAACECRCVTVSSNAVNDEMDVRLGTYCASWARDTPSAADAVATVLHVVESKAELPSVPCIRLPLSISLDLPAHGWVRTPLTIAYRLQNPMTHVQEFDFFMDSSEAFMFAGHKQVHFKILPQAELTLKYNLYPLVSGHVCLPRLHVVSHDVTLDGQVEQILHDKLPTHIFVMPQVKRWSQ